MRKTNAIRVLDSAGVDYRVHEYDLPMEEFSAEAVADLIGLPHARVFKTLVVRGRDTGPMFAVIPGGTELDLKALAAITGDKRVDMVPVREVEAMTGYPRGSVTVIGAKRAHPVIVDESATSFETIAVSAGARGLQVTLPTDVYLAITGAEVGTIARPS